MGTSLDQFVLNNILTRDLKLDRENAADFIIAIKNIKHDLYMELEDEIKKQVFISKKNVMDLHSKLLMYLLLQFYITVGFIMVFLLLIK